MHNILDTTEDALGRRTLFTYDRNNRLLTTTDPAGHVTSQAYDDVGNPASKTDGRGKTTTFSYDAQNRLTGVTNAKSDTTSYLFDANGNCLAQTDENGHVTTFEYNVRNLPIRRIDHGGRTGTPGAYTYDAAKTETYAYDAAGRMTTRIDRMGTETAWIYDARGYVLTETSELMPSAVRGMATCCPSPTPRPPPTMR